MTSPGDFFKTTSPPPSPYPSAPSILLESAVREFSKNGFEGASWRMIAKDADLPYQLITYHFGSKENLWLSAWEYLYQQRVAAINAAKFDPTGDLKEQFRGWLRTAVLFAIEDPRVLRMTVQEYFAKSPRYEKLLKPRMKKLMQPMVTSFQKLCDLGVIKHFSPDEVYIIISSVLIATSCAPFQIEIAIDAPVSSPELVELHSNLLFNLFTQGRGADSSRKKKRIKKATKKKKQL